MNNSFSSLAKVYLVKSIIILGVVFSTLNLAGQSYLDENLGEKENFKAFEEYEFLKLEKNKLILPSKWAMAHFFEKLNKLETHKNQQVHVLHIGDSHIQADFFSGKVRELFVKDQRFPVNSRGFTFPYKAAQTNNPVNYEVKYEGEWEGKRSVKSKQYSRWGLAGVNAITYVANSSIQINPNIDSQEFEIRKVKIFFPIYDQKSFQPTIVPDYNNRITSYSMGDGYLEFSLLKPQKSITIKFEKKLAKQGQFVLQGILLESNRPGLTYSASGANGAKVPTYFRCQDFCKQVVQLNPDLIIISLGTNDAFSLGFNAYQFKIDYKKLILSIRKKLPNTSILLTTVGDSYRGTHTKYPNKNNEKANTQIIALGKELNLAIWDFYQVMGAYGAIDDWFDKGLTAKDKLHLSRQGYELQGELLFSALNRAYQNYYKLK